ncbi:MAG: zincin-like metallopeptidase domain-containing protein, partial [Lachnospiraceae bacterium]|nr:zincin-like metallopeptidase domain-containing protein [Lachnospiraceae bacterium]
EMLEVADKFIQSSECKIKEVEQDSAYYSPKSDEIILPPRDYFKNQESFLSVTLHEMAHSTGHESRLNRPLMNQFGTSEYAREELIAELTGTFLQADLNIHLDGELLEDHTDYLKAWIQILKDDPNELFRACNYAEKASQYLMHNYEHELNQYVKIDETQTKLAKLESDETMKDLSNDIVLDSGEIKLEAVSESMDVEDYEI